MNYIEALFRYIRVHYYLKSIYLLNMEFPTFLTTRNRIIRNTGISQNSLLQALELEGNIMPIMCETRSNVICY
jgi:hypothetical protein